LLARSPTEVDDRIFSTSVTCKYTIPLPLNIPLGVDRLGEIDQAVGFEKTYQAARKVTLETFATHDSASVQVRPMADDPAAPSR
jgi:urate oxidase